jgi:hypothetical protein
MLDSYAGHMHFYWGSCYGQLRSRKTMVLHFTVSMTCILEQSTPNHTVMGWVSYYQVLEKSTMSDTSWPDI